MTSFFNSTSTTPTALPRYETELVPLATAMISHLFLMKFFFFFYFLQQKCFGSLIFQRSFPLNETIGYSRPGVNNHEKILYVGTLEGNLYALNYTTGDIVWDYHFNYPIDISPVVYEDSLYIPSSTTVYTFNSYNGELLWTYSCGGTINSMVEYTTGTVYVGSGNGIFYALNSTTGFTVWTFNYGTPTNFTAASIWGDYIYFGSTSGFVFKLHLADGSMVHYAQATGPVSSKLMMSSTEVFCSTSRSILRFSQADLSLLQDTPCNCTSNFVIDIAKDHGYIGCNGEGILAFDIVWGFSAMFTTGLSAKWTTPLLFRGALYIGTVEGIVFEYSATSGIQNDDVVVNFPVETSPVLLGNIELAVATLDGTISIYSIIDDLPTSNPTNSPPSTIPTSLPTELFHIEMICPVYSAVNTDDASINTTPCTFRLCPGDAVEISLCEMCTLNDDYEGEYSEESANDTYICLYDSDRTLLLENDDSCGLCSAISYTYSKSVSCELMTLEQGCYSNSACTGQSHISIFPNPQFPRYSLGVIYGDFNVMGHNGILIDYLYNPHIS